MPERPRRRDGRRAVSAHGVRAGRRARARPGGGGAGARVEVGGGGGRVVRGVVEHGRVGPVRAGGGGGRGRRVALLLQAGLRHAQGRRRGEAAGPAVKEVENIVTNRVLQRFTSVCKKFTLRSGRNRRIQY